MERTFFTTSVTIALMASAVLIPVSAASATTTVNASSAVAAVAAANADATPPATSTPTTPDASTPPSVSTTTAGVVTATDPNTSIGLKLPTSDANPTKVSGAMVFASPLAQAVVTPSSTGYQVSQVINDPAAPTSYAYKLHLPAGYSPYLQSNGTIALQTDADGKHGVAPTQADTIGFIDPAWAKDASGNDVPTSYSVKGDTVTQSVDLTGVTTYPVVADPKVTFGWVVYAFFSKSDLQAWVFTAAVDSVAAAAGAACAFLDEVPPAAIACAALVVWVWSYFKHLFTVAIHRNGGIVLEFTYTGTWAGYLYARTWS